MSISLAGTCVSLIVFYAWENLDSNFCILTIRFKDSRSQSPCDFCRHFNAIGRKVIGLNFLFIHSGHINGLQTNLCNKICVIQSTLQGCVLFFHQQFRIGCCLRVFGQPKSSDCTKYNNPKTWNAE